jgi:hypothetical protein
MFFSSSIKVEIAVFAIVGFFLGAILPLWAIIGIFALISIVLWFLVQNSGSEGLAYWYIIFIVIFAGTSAIIGNAIFRYEIANLLLLIQGRTK